MPLTKYSTLGTATSLITTGMNSLANDGRAGSSAVANSTNRNTLGVFELVVTFGTAPTAGRTVDLFLVPALDGTNYADGHDAAVDPTANSYAGSFVVRGVNTAQRLVVTDVQLPATNFKAVVVNRAGQAFAASGNVLTVRAYDYDTV